MLPARQVDMSFSVVLVETWEWVEEARGSPFPKKTQIDEGGLFLVS